MDGGTVDVVIPALDAARHIEGALAALDEARACGLLCQVIMADGGSRDDTAALARRAGARVIAGPRGRGQQLAAGAAAAGAPWLLFLHADTRLTPGWAREVSAFIADPANQERAAVFRLAFDTAARPARWIAAMANWRTRRLGLPYGDQGLLIRRELYERVGGYRPLALMEDVDLVRRLGRARLAPLRSAAVTSAERYRRAGWWPRAARNLLVLALYLLGMPMPVLRRLYGAP